ncbi:hypothetical protein DFH09DRAFT_1113242 [Mycena vulgaris]|nr:hypothetical protein DFH09DRAFT_1113242 [Mycena vulgaris]
MPSDAEKQDSHAAAQRRFRERNLEATRALAREHMKRLRAKPRSPREIQDALEKRRPADAKENELYIHFFAVIPHAHVPSDRRRRKKFVAEYGQDVFMEYYFPKYEELGTRFLPRAQFDERPAAKKKKRTRRSNCGGNSPEGLGGTK